MNSNPSHERNSSGLFEQGADPLKGQTPFRTSSERDVFDTTQLQRPDHLASEILQSRPLLRQKLARALFCVPGECEKALSETIKFLILAAENTAGQSTPSARVDLAWHEFILFTRTYQSFCETHFGKLIHHEPSDNHEVNSQQYAQTLARYRQRFGEPPAEYWGGAKAKLDQSSVSASCGNCESDQ